MRATLWSEERGNRKGAYLAIVLLLWAAVWSAVMASPVSANDEPCAGTIPPGVYDHNFIVVADCTVGPGVTINGDIFEPGETAWNITLLGGANIDGDIIERGAGQVIVVVGMNNRFNGSLKEEGMGPVHVQVLLGGSFYNGNIEEKGQGQAIVEVGTQAAPGGIVNGSLKEEDGGGVTVSVHGTYKGNAEEKGVGNVTWTITGDFNGNIVERDAGSCIPPNKPASATQPRGNVDCDTP